MSFAHLHVHTEYSLLDGFSNIKKLIKRAKEMGMPALAITDHGAMYGAIEFYRTAKEAGIKPIIGIEAYLAARTMKERDAREDKKSTHLLLLAENNTGYKNLLKLASTAQLEGFYYYPRIDKELLARHAEGLICSSGCISAEIPRLLEQGQAEAARRSLDWYFELFGRERFFLELQQHDIPQLETINKNLLELGQRYDARFIATNDVHYIEPEDWRLQDILLAIQTGTVLTDPDRMRMTDPSYFLRSPEEMEHLFKEVPDALKNTLLIAERCQINLDVENPRLPQFEVPKGETPQTYLRSLCEQGRLQRYKEHTDLPEVQQRLDYELNIIHKMGFEAYFLIVWDLCRYACQEGIWYNARGSAAGSIVAYMLNITLVDPLRHGLLFERFLNPDRVSMPDIDLDFRDDRRAEMLEYAVKKYGQDKVAQIITFGTLGARAALRDVGRVMDIPLPEVDRIAKLVPNIPGKPMSLAEAIQQIPDLKREYESADHIRELMDTASKMEGVVRNAGTHAAGVVISDQPLVDYLPLHRPTSGSEETPVKIVTQFEMGILEQLKMLKVDFLGLATLTYMARACEMIEKRHSVRLHLGNIPTDDSATFQMLGEGNTAGLFQLEGSGMTRWLMQMKPSQLEHVIAMVALFRPGPMDFIPHYISRMHGEQPVEYRHPSLAPIFDSTFGIPVYQEQLMRAAVELAGYTPSESDELRAAISKKKKREIGIHRGKFVAGASARGIPQDIAEAIYSDWEEFARYGFNKSHAADYGILAVQTAYLKCHYPIEFMSALLTASRNDIVKVALYIENCRSMGIEVLPLDINVSDWDFTIEDRSDNQPAIRFGFGAIKNVGQGPIDLIIKARHGVKSFRDLNDFSRRVDLRAAGKRALESLIKVGAMDNFGARTAMLNSLDRIIAVSASHFRAVQTGQMSLFGAATGVHETIILPPVPEADRREQLNWERELIGMYLSEHPLKPYIPALTKLITHLSGQLTEAVHDEKVRVAGMITSIRPHQTKTGKMMGWVTIEDIQSTIDLVVFPRAWQKYETLLEVGGIILIDGRVDAQSTPPKILVDNIRTEIKELEITEQKITPRAPNQTPVPPEPSSPSVDRSKQGYQRVSESMPVYQKTSLPQHETAEESEPPQPEAFPPGWEESLIPPKTSTTTDLVVHQTDFPDTPASANPVPASIHSSPDSTNQTQQSQTQSLSPVETVSIPTAAALPRIPITPPIDLNTNHPPQMVSVVMRPSGDPDRDTRRIGRLHGTFISFPGKDRFQFQIFEDERGHLIDFPNETTHVCAELLEKLRQAVGEENIRIETILYQ